MPNTERQYDYDKLPGLVLLWNFPNEWWKRSHWISKLLLLILFITLISSLSTAAYSTKRDKEIIRLQEIEKQQIGELNKVIDAVKNERQSESAKRDDKVLNEIGDLQEQLRTLREQASSLNNTDFNASVDQALKALEATGSATNF